MSSAPAKKAVEISRLFNEILNSGSSVAKRFDKIMSMLAQKMNADATACYLVIDDNYIELFASYAFNPKLNNHIALKVGEGIIGGIAQSKLTTEVENIWQHPDFLYRSEADEENYKSFLGTPIIRWGRAIGVLCLYKKDIYNFQKHEVEALEMLSMEFSEWAASDEVREYKNKFILGIFL